MIKIENAEIIGWEAAIRGMRNPLNSWEKSDSGYSEDLPPYMKFGLRNGLDEKTIAEIRKQEYILGDNDKDLMKRLRNAGTDHRKFMRMITVYVDITAPLYWWKEFDTYKVGTVANSCSTMHTIHKKEFTLEDFSHEHLVDNQTCFLRYGYDIDGLFIDDDDPSPWPEEASEMWTFAPLDILNVIIKGLNRYRKLYLKTKDKLYWWQMIQLLPSSYNQKRTVMCNYEVLANMYKSRKNHKIDEWKSMCDWMRGLPCHELITGEFEE